MPTLVNSILEKIDEIRVSRDSLKQIISDNMNVDTSTFKLIECMNYVENNILKPAYAIRPKFEEFVETLCPLNVRLTSTSWVSLDFAMNDISLEKDFVYLFGISASSLRCSLTNGKLSLNTGTEIVFNKEINLDTNRHTLAFGFTDETREDGHKRFQVEFDGTVVYNDFAQVPNFNLPFSLFDIPNAYDGTYENYEAEGGVPYLVNNIGYTQSKSLFDVFALNVYDMVNGERKAIRAYAPGLDAEQRTTFLEKISGEYQYPTGGRYLYIKILSDTTTVITNSVFDKPLPILHYYKPSAGAIIPTDIKFTSLTHITIHVKGIDNFESETDLSARVMMGARPNFSISPFNRNDVERGLPLLENKPEYANLLGDSSIGLFFDGCGHSLYSIASQYGGEPQTWTMDGEHIIEVGYNPNNMDDIANDNYLWKIITIDGQGECHGMVGPTPTPIVQFVNNQMKTPLCIFGNYNEPSSETMTPDEVIELGYQNALNQLGYTTGARYAVKQIDISVRNLDGTMTTTHRLVGATDGSGVNYLKDTVSGSSYYPFNGTLDRV